MVITSTCFKTLYKTCTRTAEKGPWSSEDGPKSRSGFRKMWTQVIRCREQNDSSIMGRAELLWGIARINPSPAFGLIPKSWKEKSANTVLWVRGNTRMQVKTARDTTSGRMRIRAEHFLSWLKGCSDNSYVSAGSSVYFYTLNCFLSWVDAWKRRLWITWWLGDERGARINWVCNYTSSFGSLVLRFCFSQ